MKHKIAYFLLLAGVLFLLTASSCDPPPPPPTNVPSAVQPGTMATIEALPPGTTVKLVVPGETPNGNTLQLIFATPVP